MHHRHLRPWELFQDSDTASAEYASGKGSFDSMGSGNSYEDEPWVAQYEKRNLIRKIFDREVWIKEPALRQIQDTIFVQALITAFVIGAIITAVFLAVSFGSLPTVGPLLFLVLTSLIRFLVVTTSEQRPPPMPVTMTHILLSLS